MNDFIKYNLCTLIIGDEKNERFDGRTKECGLRDGLSRHTDSVEQIALRLEYEGYFIGELDYSHINETGFGVINKGHVLFCNCSTGNYTFGYLYIPDYMTEKQINSLRIYEETLKKFDTLYLFKVDENNKEVFDSITFKKNFNVDSILKKNNSEKMIKKTK